MKHYTSMTGTTQDLNPKLDLLQPYPFQKFSKILAGITPSSDYSEIRLSIGEPRHATPAFIQQALADALGGLSSYPTTQGTVELRGAIAQ